MLPRVAPCSATIAQSTSRTQRERDALEDIATELQWPTQHDRVVAAARGIYLGQPDGVPTWSGYKQSERLDIKFRPGWT